MKPEILDYIRFRIARSHETMRAADILLEQGMLYDTVNRLYYACFYAVSALLLCENKSSSKHGGIRALFDRDWVNTGRVPSHMGQFYRHLFNYRQKGDYQDLVEFSRDKVEAWSKDAADFVRHVAAEAERLLEKISTLQDPPV